MCFFAMFLFFFEKRHVMFKVHEFFFLIKIFKKHFCLKKQIFFEFAS